MHSVKHIAWMKEKEVKTVNVSFKRYPKAYTPSEALVCVSFTVKGYVLEQLPPFLLLLQSSTGTSPKVMRIIIAFIAKHIKDSKERLFMCLDLIC